MFLVKVDPDGVVEDVVVGEPQWDPPVPQDNLDCPPESSRRASVLPMSVRHVDVADGPEVDVVADLVQKVEEHEDPPDDQNPVRNRVVFPLFRIWSPNVPLEELRRAAAGGRPGRSRHRSLRRGRCSPPPQPRIQPRVDQLVQRVVSCDEWIFGRSTPNSHVHYIN